MPDTKRGVYSEQPFDRLSGLEGISDEQIREHLALYAGYVRQVNTAQRGAHPAAHPGPCLRA
jgi:hypothetical protein